MKHFINVHCIIATFNGEKWIEQCLKSVFRSSVQSSVVVVDNDSSDSTVQIIKEKYPQVVLIENNTNLGFGKANNIGIKKAFEQGADYFFLLNQDAWVEPDTIRKLIDMQKKQPRYGILSPLHLKDNQNLDEKFRSYLNGNGDDIINGVYSKENKAIIDVKFVNAAIWLVSRKCFEEVGLFAPIFGHYAEDLNFVHRCKYHNVKVGVLPHARAYHAREQNPPKELNVPFGKLLSREKSYWQGILLNINHSLTRQLFYLFFNSIKEIIKSIFLFRFKTIFVVLNRVKCLPMIGELNTHRAEMNKKGSFFSYENNNPIGLN